MSGGTTRAAQTSSRSGRDDASASSTRGAEVGAFPIIGLMRPGPRPVHAVGVNALDQLASWIGEMLARHMLDVGDAVVVVLNADRRIVLLNQAATRLGWDRECAVGRSWADFARPHDSVPVRVAADAHRRPYDVRLGDGSWVRLDCVSYTGNVEPYGTVSVLVIDPG